MEYSLYVDLGGYCYDFEYDTELEALEDTLKFWERYPAATCRIYRTDGWFSISLTEDD